MLKEQKQNELMMRLIDMSINHSNDNIERVQDGLSSNKQFLEEIMDLNGQIDKNIDDMTVNSDQVSGTIANIKSLGNQSEENSNSLHSQMEEIDNVVSLIRRMN